MKLRQVYGLLKFVLRVAVIVGLFLAMGARQRVFAQEKEGIALAVRFGLDNHCNENAWIPVRATVENTGPDVSARVQVSYENSSGGTTSSGEDLLLPTTSRKEVWLYFYPQDFMRKLNVNVTAGGKTLASKDITVNCLSADNSIFGVLADEPSAYDSLAEVQPLGGFVRTAQLRVADLPDRPQGWMALDALVVSGADTGALTEAQRESLGAWIANGGKLLVVGGPQWQATTAGLEDFLPVEIASTQTVGGLSELARYFRVAEPPEGPALIAFGSVRPGSVVLVQQGSYPLLVEKQIGFGKVIYLAADPSLQPLRDWEGMKEVYGYLLGSKPVRPTWTNSDAWDAYALNRAISTLNSLNMPGYPYFCGWLFLYVIVVGPVNFFILRRLKRRELAWWTIPALALLFSGIAYYYGGVYRGQRPILNRIAVVQAWDGSDTSEVRGVVGLYSPSRTKYSLQADEHFLLYPFERNGEGIQAGNNWLALREGERALLPEVRVEIGGLQKVSAQGNLPALKFEHDLVVTLSARDPLVTGTVTNASGLTLRDAVLVTPGSWIEMGDFPPGKTQNVRIFFSPNPDGPAFYSIGAQSILNVDYYSSTTTEETIRRSELWNAATLSDESPPPAGNWGIYLMGWLEEPILPVSLQGQAFDVIDTTLYVMKLDPAVKIEAGPIRLSPGFLVWESSSAQASPYLSEISSSGHILRFRPALPIPFQSTEKLSVNLGSPSLVGPEEISAFLWDFESGKWTKIEGLIWGINIVSDPAIYVGPGGEVWLKLTGQSNNYIVINPSTITLTVTP